MLFTAGVLWGNGLNVLPLRVRSQSNKIATVLAMREYAIEQKL
jgi:hypothetical protein